MEFVNKVETGRLPFSPDKQRAVLGHVLMDKDFFTSVISKLETDWFSEELTRRIFGVAKKRYKLHGRIPTMQEIIDDEEIQKNPQDLIHKLRANMSLAKTSCVTYGKEGILNEMEAWMRTRLIQLALPKATFAFNSENIEECAAVLNRMVRDFYETKFDGDGAESFRNYRAELMAEEYDRSRAMTIGLEGLDRLIDPNGQVGSGSLFRGDMTILLAPTNVGKTSAMITVAAHNIARNKSVLFLTHEGGKREIKNKIMRAISRMNKPEMLRAYEDQEQASKMEAIEEIVNRYLTYVPMNKPGLTVEEVALTVEKFQQKKKASSTSGQGYDLLIDDYPAKLQTELARGGFFQKRHIDEEVYNQFVQMGLKHDFHVLTAIQTNRSGSVVNKNSHQGNRDKRLLQMEDVAESWGPMTAAATVISMNRNGHDIKNNKITFYVCKSRSGETGWAVVANTDYDRCRTHSNDLGCFWYRGEDNLSDVSVALMQGFKGQAVPNEKIEFYNTVGT